MTTPELTNLDHRYSSIRYVGDGGMGKVYQARHKRLDRDDAIKVLKKRCAEDREFVERSSLDQGWHLWRLEVQGNTVLEGTDNRYVGSGEIGMFSKGAQINVRSFRYTEL